MNTPTLTSAKLKSWLITQFDSYVETVIDGFENVDPKQFAKAAIEAKKQVSWSSKIKLDSYSSFVDASKLFLEKIDAAREVINGKDFDALWNCFELNMCYGVMGGENWQVYLQYNGSLLIRNHHRVLGISEQPVLDFNIHSSLVKHHLYEIINSLKIKETEDKLKVLLDKNSKSPQVLKLQEKIDSLYDHFEVIYHDNDGVHKSRKLPTVLNTTGQTIIVLPISWVEHARNKNIGFFNDDQLYDCIQNSRTQNVILRLFENRVFVHTIYRDSDEKDLLLDYFSLYLGDDIYPEVQKLKDYKYFIEDEINNVLSNDNLDLKFHFSNTLNLLCKDTFKKSVSNQLTRQLCDQPRFFNTSPNYPVAYYKTSPDYYKFVESLNLVCLQFDLNLLNHNNPEADFKKKIKLMFSDMSYIKNIHVHITASKYDLETIVNINDSVPLTEAFNVLKKHIAALIKPIKSNKNLDNESKLEEIKDTLMCDDYKINILVETVSDPEPKVWQEEALNIGSLLDTSFNLEIPKYGYVCGISGEDLDTGNNLTLISEN